MAYYEKEVLIAKALKLYEQPARSDRREVAAILRDWSFETTGRVTEKAVMAGIGMLHASLPAFMSHHDDATLLRIALSL